ncbi:MAG: hypothetical protein GEV05_12440 [Betaproteobacteria bacterium]|nr:hypothetical protein [Betaproteobacteria bacterium]
MSKRVGLLTLPLHTNYGGILQAVALYWFLTSELNKDVVFLERASSLSGTSPLHRTAVGLLEHLPWLPTLQSQLTTMAEKRPPLSRLLPSGLTRKLLEKADIALRARRAKGHQPFLNRFVSSRSGKLTTTRDMAAAIHRFGIDTLVVGSDQVWRLEYLPRGAEEDFFFGFAPSPAIRKVAYAASFGHGNWTYPQLTTRIKALLAQFDAVSVREASGVEICAKVFDRNDALHVIDPTLLIDPAFYVRIAEPVGRKPGKSFLSYVLDEEPDRPIFSREVQRALEPDHSYHSLTLDAGATTLDVSGWVRAFVEADFVLTDSFHGMAFSIIFRKNFIAIVNRNRGADRFTSLLSQLGLMDRLVSDAAPDRLRELVRTPIDFAVVDEKLKELQATSIAFLRQALG